MFDLLQMRTIDRRRAHHRKLFAVAAVLAGLLFGTYLLWEKSDRIVDLLVQPLEQRFQRADITAPETLTGIVVLTGGDARLPEGGQLARNHPHLKVVISGADGIRSVVAGLGEGIDPSRILLETRSRNTYENAIYSNEVIKPKPGERWLLVTSALHMPRSIGSFRKVGFEVEPWPVYDLSLHGSQINSALREWLGLVAYRILGRTSALFPAPAK